MSAAEKDLRDTDIAMAFVLLLALAGCVAVPSQQAARVQEADPTTVANCHLLGTLVGRSLIGGVVSTGAENAMVDVKEKAAAMGATHIVFGNVYAGGQFDTGAATGRAYRCN